MDEVEKQIGLKIVDSRSLTGHTSYNKNRAEIGFYGDQTVPELMEIKTTGLLPSAADLYFSEIYAQVATLYADDISMFEQHFGSVEPF